MVGAVRGERGGGQELSRKGTPKPPEESQGITAAGLDQSSVGLGCLARWGLTGTGIEYLLKDRRISVELRFRGGSYSWGEARRAGV